MLRGRLTPLLTGLPTEVRWQTAQLPDLPNASPGTVLGVLRIVQEALTNALKHANAGTVSIEAAWLAPLLEINIRDDGRGFDRELITAGRGLSSLAHRAAAIGGRLIVVSAPGQGTRVSLRLPLGHGAGDGAATE
jgi:signal transduction histidine kinase